MMAIRPVEGEVEKFARNLVHATYAQNLVSIASHGLLWQSTLQGDILGRAFVHLVPVAPTDDWSHYVKIAKAPWEATAYVWLKTGLAADRPLHMTEGHSILSSSVHPSWIEAMGIWTQG